MAEIILENLAHAYAPGAPYALKAAIGADDADVVPHQAANFVPVLRDHDGFIRRLGVAAFPGRDGGWEDGADGAGVGGGASPHHHAFEQRVAGQTACAM